MRVLGVDPGVSGGFFLFDGASGWLYWPMPTKRGVKDRREVDFQHVWRLIRRIRKLHPETHIFLEQAKPFRMGMIHAFNYGRGFAMLEVACQMSGLPMTFISPHTWTKAMHAGVSGTDPKRRSALAVERLYPKIAARLPRGPKSGRLDEGAVDALLIAGYGFRTLAGFSQPVIKANAKLQAKLAEREFLDTF